MVDGKTLNDVKGKFFTSMPPELSRVPSVVGWGTATQLLWAGKKSGTRFFCLLLLALITVSGERLRELKWTCFDGTATRRFTAILHRAKFFH